MALLVIGLGNPGDRYRHTRHNVGFWIAEEIAKVLDLDFKKKTLQPYRVCSSHSPALVLVEPLTYMNESGKVWTHAVKEAGYTDSVVILCDNLDLPVGQVRLRLKGSSGGHRGLESIFRHAGTTDIPRLTIGIGRPVRKEDVIPYVLETPPPEERELYEASVVRAAQAVLRLAQYPPDQVMNEINRKPDPAA